MQIDEMLSGARDAISVKRVYGDPYEKNGLTVIPAATVRGGGGGGSGESEGETGGGGGFGMVARPSGAWVVEDGDVTWKPAIDVNRIVLGGQLVTLVAMLITGRILLAHTRRERPARTLLSRLLELRNLRLHVRGLVHR
jgi:uncharacterized spore protein YtfJ